MGRFQLELIYRYFPPFFHLTVCYFCPVGLSLLIQHFPQVLWVLKLFLSPGQKTEVTSTSTRPVKNVLTTKGVQDRNNQLLDERTVENKGKLISLSNSILVTLIFY